MPLATLTSALLAAMPICDRGPRINYLADGDEVWLQGEKIWLAGVDPLGIQR